MSECVDATRCSFSCQLAILIHISPPGLVFLSSKTSDAKSEKPT